MTPPANTQPPSVVFDTHLTAFGTNTVIVVPPELVDRLGAGKRSPVDVEVNGYRFRTTIGVMKGQHHISVSAAVRKDTGLAGGDAISVTLTLNSAPRDRAVLEGAG